MTLWGCGLQPAVAGGFVYADLRSELNTYLALQALFTQISPVQELLLQAFPFPSTLGEVTLHQLSQASVFIYSSHGKWDFPSLLWSFPPTATFTSFPAPGFWACSAAPAFSGPPCLFSVLWGSPLPPLQSSGHPILFATCVYCCYCLLFSFSLFPWVGVGLSRGNADRAQGCLWEYRVPLSSPCGPHLSKQSGHWRLAAVWEPSWFLHLMWSGDALHRLEVWRSQSFASSWWFFL
jgi:hypothetical protein